VKKNGKRDDDEIFIDYFGSVLSRFPQRLKIDDISWLERRSRVADDSAASL